MHKSEILPVCTQKWPSINKFRFPSVGEGIHERHNVMSDDYVVYGLEDPRDKLYHYIGITNDVYRRFNEHVTGSSGNIEKNSWIFECRQAKIMIAMHEIERVPTVEEASQREKHWIAHYHGLGHPLHNSAIPGKKVVVDPGKFAFKHALKKDDPQQSSEKFLIISNENRIIAWSRLQLEQERNCTLFHLYPLAFGLFAAFLCAVGATELFLLWYAILRLTWLFIACSGSAICAVILGLLYYTYMHSLGLTEKKKHTTDVKE